MGYMGCKGRIWEGHETKVDKRWTTQVCQRKPEHRDRGRHKGHGTRTSARGHQGRQALAYIGQAKRVRKRERRRPVGRRVGTLGGCPGVLSVGL